MALKQKADASHVCGASGQSETGEQTAPCQLPPLSAAPTGTPFETAPAAAERSAAQAVPACESASDPVDAIRLWAHQLKAAAARKAPPQRAPRVPPEDDQPDEQASANTSAKGRIECRPLAAETSVDGLRGGGGGSASTVLTVSGRGTADDPIELD